MDVKQLAAMLLAATILIAGATGPIAAAPGNAPKDAGEQTNENPGAADEDHSAEEAERDDTNDSAAVVPAENANASDGDVSASHAQGPNKDLPEQVPDHVAEIHSLISSFLNDDIETLGEAISGVIATDASADENADAGDDTAANSNDDAEATATETPTPTSA